MSENALPKGYEPHAVEDHWREYWEKNKTFTPDPDAPGEPFSIVIPPPNVTGALHIGHALNHTLIDVLCRHARQKASRPRSWRVLPSLARARSNTFWVAMPAWSVPGSQSTFLPFWRA